MFHVKCNLDQNGVDNSQGKHSMDGNITTVCIITAWIVTLYVFNDGKCPESGGAVTNFEDYHNMEWLTTPCSP